MQTKTETYRIAMALVRGSRIERDFLTPAELRDVFHALVESVGPDGAFAELALIDGREAIVRFPKLSDEFISVRSANRLKAADFAFLPDRGSEVWGGDPQRFATLLAVDLRRYWWMPIGVAALTVAAQVSGAASSFVATVGQLLVVASSLFFTVFVIFGIGQVVRPVTAHSLYRSGSLQAGLDADRYCVRLAIAAFALALVAVAWDLAGPGVAEAMAKGSQPFVVDLPCLGLLWLSAVGILLSMLATVGYLLDRSAELALAQTALQAFEAAADRRERAHSAPTSEPRPSAEERPRP